MSYFMLCALNYGLRTLNLLRSNPLLTAQSSLPTALFDTNSNETNNVFGIGHSTSSCPPFLLAYRHE